MSWPHCLGKATKGASRCFLPGFTLSWHFGSSRGAALPPTKHPWGQGCPARHQLCSGSDGRQTGTHRKWLGDSGEEENQEIH